jgi:hypothetical protein
MCQQGVTTREKESILTKRVPFGELLTSRGFSTRPGSLLQTPRAIAPGVLRFTPVLTTTYGDASPRESFLKIARKRRIATNRPFLSPKLSRSRLNRAGWVNSPVGFWPAEGTRREIGKQPAIGTSHRIPWKIARRGGATRPVEPPAYSMPHGSRR